MEIKTRGRLYLVATPIGNLEDISLRAQRILKKVDIILAEDTRVLEKLLKGAKIAPVKGRRLSFYRENAPKRTAQIIAELKKGKEVALVTNAGTPVIADPGVELVRACLQDKIPLSPIPGPSALVAALSLSGFEGKNFIFLGFSPKKSAAEEKLLRKCFFVSQQTPFKTFVLYQSPRRLLNTLGLIKKVFGNINVFLAQELTKINEKGRLKKVEDWLKELANQRRIRGEVTLVFHS